MYGSNPRLRSTERTHASSSFPLPQPISARRLSSRYHALPGGTPPRRVLTFLKVAIPVAIILLIAGYTMYEPHFELSFYERAWVKSELEPITPLRGCFDSPHVSRLYNVSENVYGRRRTEVHSGLAMRMGMDCYDFAGTIKPSESDLDGFVEDGGRVNYHTYWRVDLAPFTERQEWMLKSYFATQDIQRTKLILWSNGDLSGNQVLQKWLRRFPDAFELKVADIEELSRGTELEGSSMLNLNDKKAWVDGDLIRLLLLWQYGGVWVDMDSLLTRDMSPLLEHEFVTQWDCYGSLFFDFISSTKIVLNGPFTTTEKAYQPLNGAMMHFRQHSPYLCEAFHIMHTSTPPRPGSTDWGSVLYHRLWRRLVAGGVPPFKILPFCFTDGRSCRLDNRLPDPFVSDRGQTMSFHTKDGGSLDQALQKVFSIHLHNQWEKAYPKDGWVERLLLGRYQKRLETL